MNVTPLIYATCDRAYHYHHSQAFVNSAEKFGMKVKLEVIDKNYDDLWRKLNPQHPKVFYCFARFLLLPELLNQHEHVLITDIDSVFNSKIEFDDKYDLGLFFRPWLSRENLKVLCAASYFTRKAKPFAEMVRAKIFSGNREWCDDQTAIWQTYLEIGSEYNVLKLNKKFLNYDFDTEAPIWTAKGVHRKKDPVYLARKHSYEGVHAY